MKPFRFFVATFFTLLLASCIDTEEKIDINADNSGMYSMTIDMGKVIGMAASMGAQADDANLKEKKDTVIYLKDLLDSASDLSIEQKNLYRDGKIHVKMDAENSEMKLMVTCPFKDAAGLTSVKNNLFTVINKLKAMDKATGELPSGDDGKDADMASKSTNPLGDQYNFVATNGMISNTIKDANGIKNMIVSDSTLTMMQQMSSMLGEFTYRTILTLPKPIKKFEGPNSDVSSDKKTIRFETNLTEMIENPEKVSYKVAY